MFKQKIEDSVRTPLSVFPENGLQMMHRQIKHCLILQNCIVPLSDVTYECVKNNILKVCSFELYICLVPLMHGDMLEEGDV